MYIVFAQSHTEEWCIHEQLHCICTYIKVHVQTVHMKVHVLFTSPYLLFGVLCVYLGHNTAEFLHELHTNLSSSALLAHQTQPHGTVDPPSLVEREEIVQE